jgi:MYXO-CTERM domain-containing protein
VAVNLSGSSAMGMGMVSYTGVDQQSPTGVPVMNTGAASPVRVVVPVTGPRPILGASCIGGSWGLMNGPDAVAASNDVNLWDFTEQNVVGLGNHQAMFSGGSASISWNVSFADPFSWGAVGLSITPVGGAPPPPPDAAPDLAPDVAPDLAVDTRVPADLAVPVDLAPPPEDAGVAADAEEPSPSLDAEEGTPEADAEAPPPFDSAPADTAPPDPDDAGNTIRGVDLEVGCACRLGGARLAPPWFSLLLGLLVLGLRRRRR